MTLLRSEYTLVGQSTYNGNRIFFLRTVILLSSGKKIKLKKAATTATTKNSNISAVKGMYKLDL